MNENELSYEIIGAAMEVHSVLGSGLLESAYEAALAIELSERNVRFERQSVLPVMYKGRTLDAGFRADFIVADRVIVELKAIEKLAPIHEVQLLTYLRAAGKQLGLLLNFHALSIRDGIRRVVNGL